MGKKRLRKKTTSVGKHGSVSKGVVRAVRASRDPHDTHQHKLDSWKKLQNPWITIANPVKSETNRLFIRVRANDYFGPPKAATG
jgi:flagellar biosynthesis regulator FlaF